MRTFLILVILLKIYQYLIFFLNYFQDINNFLKENSLENKLEDSKELKLFEISKYQEVEKQKGNDNKFNENNYTKPIINEINLNDFVDFSFFRKDREIKDKKIFNENSPTKYENNYKTLEGSEHLK